MRRMAGGMGQGPQSVMSFGKTRAKVQAESDTGVGFKDVAGVDEAVDELREIVEFLKTPEKFRRLGGPHPQGRAAGGPAGHGQDAARPRGGGRGGGALLQPLRLRVRGDVRRRGRRPRARPLRAGHRQGAVHHLHRRAGRHRQEPQRGGRRWPRRARADAQPAPGGDGRLRQPRRPHHPRGHQPAGDPRQRADAPGPLRPAGAGGPPGQARAASGCWRSTPAT